MKQTTKRETIKTCSDVYTHQMSSRHICQSVVNREKSSFLPLTICQTSFYLIYMCHLGKRSGDRKFIDWNEEKRKNEFFSFCCFFLLLLLLLLLFSCSMSHSTILECYMRKYGRRRRRKTIKKKIMCFWNGLKIINNSICWDVWTF